MIFVLLTPACAMTIINKIRIFCNDVNKTSTFVELLAINILLYRVRQNKISQRENRAICIMQEYFYTKFSIFIHHIRLHKSA